MNPDDWYLEDVIAGAVAATPAGEPSRDTARRILAAIGGRAPADWVVTRVATLDGKPSAITAVSSIGEDKAESIACTHLWSYSNGTLAIDENPDPDNVDYLHICCLDSHIADMVALRELKRRANEGADDLPPCRHASAHWTKPGDEPRPCQACGTPATSQTRSRPPSQTGQVLGNGPLALIYVGTAPEDRDGAWRTGAAVAVHDECAGPAPEVEQR